VKTEPIQTDEDFIGSDIFLTENQSKPNRYTPRSNQTLEIKRLNCSFSLLIFPKLRFWSPKKKNNKTVLAPPPEAKKKIKITCGTSLRVPRQRRPSQYQPWGPKLPQVQNLGACFVVFFIEGQNHNFEKVKGLKLQLSQIKTHHSTMVPTLKLHFP